MNYKIKSIRSKYRAKALDWRPTTSSATHAEKDGHEYWLIQGQDGMWNLNVDGKVIGKPVRAMGDLVDRAERAAKKIAASGPPIEKLLDFKDGIAEHQGHIWQIHRTIPAYRGAPTSYLLRVDGKKVGTSGKIAVLENKANELANKGGEIEVGPKDNKQKVDLSPKKAEGSEGGGGTCERGQTAAQTDCKPAD